MAEVLEHLALVEGRVAGLFGMLLADAPRLDAAAGGVATESIVPAFATVNAASLLRTRFSRPAKVSAATAMATLEQTRQQLLALLDKIESERDLSKVSRQHPVLGPLDGYQWIHAVGGRRASHDADCRNRRGTRRGHAL